MKSLLAAASMLCATMAFAAAGESFVPLKSLVLPDGRTLVAGAVRSDTGYTFAVERLLPDGRPDPAFGADGSGIAQIPFWRYYEFAFVLVLQPDGRILVGGNAADPLLRDTPGGRSCHPAMCLTYPAIARLQPDGSLDTSFNGNGRVALAIGNANDSLAGTQDYGTLAGLNLDIDGSIYVVSEKEGVVVAGLYGNGGLDLSFKNELNLIPREVVFARNQGLWSTEDGWKLAISQQGNKLFGIWFLSDETGSPSWGSWLVWVATQVGLGAYDGRLYEARGPGFNITPFDPSRVASRDVGSATLAVDADGTGGLSYVIGSRAGTKRLKRSGAGRTCTWGAQPDLSLATNYDGHWWAAPAGSESGWGLHLTHQDDVIQLAWMTYDQTGAPVWFEAFTRRQPDGRFVGQLSHQTDGAPYGDPGDLESVGSAVLSFTDGNAGTFRYAMNGVVSEAKAITRFVFDAPGTICSR